MPLRPAFAPYHLDPGILPEEASRTAALQSAGPLVVATADPLPAPLVSASYANLPVGRAASEAEACRAADGTPSGMGGPPRACLTSERHRARVADAARAALSAGFAGVAFDRPDASLAQGLFGAGFCAECQREFARRLVREYGDQFQPLDYLRLTREAVAQAPGAVDYTQLPFGRDFWRFRHDSLDRSLRAEARAARDAARAAGRPFAVAAWMEAVGPAQLAASRHVDAAVFPAPASGEPSPGLFALLRAAMGRRPVAVLPPAGATPAQRVRLAITAAPYAVGLAGLEPVGEVAGQLGRIRALVADVAARQRMPGTAAPVFECALFYSSEADLWTGGRHRRAIELAAAALASQHVQAPVVLRLADVPAAATVVLAGAEGLTPLEAREILRRLENGGGVLAFGDPSSVDEAGRGLGGFLPAGKPSGVKVNAGTVAQAIRPFPQFNAALTPRWSPLGNSWYDSLQVKVTKRYSRGLDLTAAFTWAKELSTNGTNGDVFNRATLKGLTGGGIPFIFVTGFNYELPRLGGNKIVRAAMGGWTIGGLLRYQSGTLIAVPTSNNNLTAHTFQATRMARVPGESLFVNDINCGCLDPYKDLAFNPKAWRDVPQGQWGPSTPFYSDFRNPRHPDEQLSLGRRFSLAKLREGMSFEVRGEFFNVFNRLMIANPGGAPSNATTFDNQGRLSGGFGRIDPTATTGGLPRNGQLVGRFRF